ncbi:MAG: hypothetical protein ACRDJM_01630 [Actinomycetota bacterium]
MKSLSHVASILAVLLTVVPLAGAEEATGLPIEHCLPLHQAGSWDLSAGAAAGAQCSETSGAVWLSGSRDAGAAPVVAPHINHAQAQVHFQASETLSQPVEGPRTYTVILRLDEAWLSDQTPPSAMDFDGIQFSIGVSLPGCGCGNYHQQAIVGIGPVPPSPLAPVTGEDSRFSRANETLTLSVTMEPHGEALPQGRVEINVIIAGYSKYSPGPARFSLIGRVMSITAS